MRQPEDAYSSEQLDAMGAEYFRWRYCPSCRVEMPTQDEVPPYSWVHDTATGEHHTRPR